MNIAVIRLKDVFKYLVGIMMVLISTTVLARFFSSIYLSESGLINRITNHAFTETLDISLSLMSYANSDEEDRTIRISSVNSILNLELSMLDSDVLQTSGIHINEEELTIDDIDELETILGESAERAIVERVEERNLPERSTNYRRKC